MGYWEDCISEAFEDAKIEATEEQINTVASWVEGCHDNYGMAQGYDAIPVPEPKRQSPKEAIVAKDRTGYWSASCNETGRRVGGLHSSKLLAYVKANQEGYLVV